MSLQPTWPYTPPNNYSVFNPNNFLTNGGSGVTYTYLQQNYYNKVQTDALLALKLNLSGGTMTGTLNSRTVLPVTTSLYNLGSSSKVYDNIYVNDVWATSIHATNFFIISFQNTESPFIEFNTSNAAATNIGNIFDNNGTTTSTITNVTVAANVITILTVNTFSNGDNVTITGTTISGEDINNLNFKITSRTGTQVVGNFTHDAIPSTLTPGTLTLVTFSFFGQNSSGVIQAISGLTTKPTSSSGSLGNTNMTFDVAAITAGAGTTNINGLAITATSIQKTPATAAVSLFTTGNASSIQINGSGRILTNLGGSVFTEGALFMGNAGFYNSTFATSIQAGTLGANNTLTLPTTTSTITALGNTTTGTGTTLVLSSGPTLTAPVMSSFVNSATFNLPSGDTASGQTCPLSSDGSGNLIFSNAVIIFKSVTISSTTALANVNTTPILLLAAPGAANYIQLHKVVMNLSTGTIAFTANQVLYCSYGNTSGEATNVASSAFGGGALLPLTTSTDYLCGANCGIGSDIFSTGANTAFLTSSNVKNKGIYLNANGNPATGNGTAVINLWYFIRPAN